MAAVRAADLPEGSIVASDVHVWIKQAPRGSAPWLRTGSADSITNARVDIALTSGRATVLRHGYGEEA